MEIDAGLGRWPPYTALTWTPDRHSLAFMQCGMDWASWHSLTFHHALEVVLAEGEAVLEEELRDHLQHDVPGQVRALDLVRLLQQLPRRSHMPPACSVSLQHWHSSVA